MSTKLVMHYSAALFRKMPSCTWYVGLSKEGTFVSWTFNCTSKPSMYANSDSTISTVSVAVSCADTAPDFVLTHKATLMYW